MEKLKLAAASIMPSSGAEKITAFMREAAEAGASLILFPECSLTGYEPDRAAELSVVPDDCESAESVRKTAEELGIAVCFGYMERSGDKLYITQELYSGSGAVRYRKTHLGNHEKDIFSAGNSFPVAEIDVNGEPVRIGMQLCWESHIPEISGTYRENGAEILLVPYASGMSGERCRENWMVHLPARASDNGCFVAACNLLLERGDSVKGGGAAVWDPKGKVIAEDFSSGESMIYAEIGGQLPRELPDGDMHNISYFDRVRRELF